MLATDVGEELLRVGDCARFKAGDPDGHCLQNRGTAAAMVLEIGSRIPGEYATYSDIDMKTEPGVEYVHKDGKPYPNTTRRGAGLADPEARYRSARSSSGSPSGLSHRSDGHNATLFG